MKNTENSAFDIFSHKEGVEFYDRIILVNKKIIGLLVPSTLIGRSIAGTIRIYGRKGIFEVEKNTPGAFSKALIAADAVCYGSPESVQACNELLKNDATSRTVSYFISCGGTCDEIIERVKIISDSNLLVAGCGGIGALVALNLCGAGVKNIHLVDGDTIEKSNLNRQFFWTINDVGRKKCDVLQSVLEERYVGLNVKVTDFAVQREDFKVLTVGKDAAIISADEPLGISQAAAESAKCFVLNTGYVHSHLYYSILGDAIKSRTSDITWTRNPWFIGPSYGPNNTELAALASGIVLQHLINKTSFGVSEECSWSSAHFPRSPIRREII